MAYFGRRPEKPGSTPGAGAGNVERAAGGRMIRRALRVAGGGRMARQEARARAPRAVVQARAARSAR